MSERREEQQLTGKRQIWPPLEKGLQEQLHLATSWHQGTRIGMTKFQSPAAALSQKASSLAQENHGGKAL
jgi:hypothetical protein